MTPCRLTGIYRHFGRTTQIHLQDRRREEQSRHFQPAGDNYTSSKCRIP